MVTYITNNLIAFIALLISIGSFLLAFNTHFKSIIKLKISYDIDNSYCFGFIHFDDYKLLIVDLIIENNSTNNIDITCIELIDGNDNYLSTKINIADVYNPNGISLVDDDHKNCIKINMVSENIMNTTRISSYGVLKGYAVFKNVNPSNLPKKYKIVVKTPSKSFAKYIIINPLPKGFNPINKLED